MANGNTPLIAFPSVNLCGLDLEKSPGSEKWNKAKEQMMEIIKSHGFFHADFDEITPEMAEQLFGDAYKQLLDLPLETKSKNKYKTHFYEYVGVTPLANNEKFFIKDALSLDSIEKFTRFFWPKGNQEFQDAVWNFVQRMFKVEAIVRKMIIEGLGLKGEYFEWLSENFFENSQLMRYGTPVNKESCIAFGCHLDFNFMSLLYQRDEGLELKTNDGAVWLQAPTNAVIVMFGEAIQAWSNDRIQPTPHRVRMTKMKNESRYSIGVGTTFKDDHWIKCPDELIDKDHPAVFKPFEYTSYLKFRHFKTVFPNFDGLKVFCGINYNNNNNNNDDDDDNNN